MKLGVDRRRSDFLTIKTGKGAGKEIIAHLSWGEDSDPMPVSVAPIIQIEGTEYVLDKIDGPFESIEHANQLALQLATDWYDRQNG